MLTRIFSLLSLLLLGGCVQIPENIEPVSNFKLNNYLGTWYEIARLDHSFERGLSKVSAQYSMKEDGGVNVLNKGYSSKSDTWKQALGKAYFADTTDRGYLKVSFFGPFYGSYVIFELDQDNYQYSLVCGPDRSYLWILSRTPAMDKIVLDNLVAKAREAGFDTDKLIFVEQEQ